MTINLKAIFFPSERNINLFFLFPLVITLVVIIAMMFYRHRRKSAYNKFDNQFQYNHDEDTVRYEGPPEG